MPVRKKTQEEQLQRDMENELEYQMERNIPEEQSREADLMRASESQEDRKQAASELGRRAGQYGGQQRKAEFEPPTGPRPD